MLLGSGSENYQPKANPCTSNAHACTHALSPTLIARARVHTLSLVSVRGSGTRLAIMARCQEPIVSNTWLEEKNTHTHIDHDQQAGLSLHLFFICVNETELRPHFLMLRIRRPLTSKRPDPPALLRFPSCDWIGRRGLPSPSPGPVPLVSRTVPYRSSVNDQQKCCRPIND